MRQNPLIYILLFTLALIPLCGCVSQDDKSQDGMSGGLLVPEENLPEGITFVGVIDESTKGANLTEEIEDFYGAEDIGDVKAIVGIYQLGPIGEGDRFKVTLVEAADEDHAKAALNNYLSQEEFQKPPLQAVERFSTAVVNGHDVVEIRDKVWPKDIRYLYLWNNGDVTVLVEGNGDRAKSLEMASATGL